MTNTQQRILNAIPYGQDNAITNKYLAFKTDLSARKVQSEIQQMRLDGKLIASTTHPPYGYYIPLDGEETDSYINQLRHRVSEQVRVLKKQEHAACGEQMEMGVGF
jgi:hypothetical protein